MIYRILYRRTGTYFDFADKAKGTRCCAAYDPKLLGHVDFDMRKKPLFVLLGYQAEHFHKMEEQGLDELKTPNTFYQIFEGYDE